MSESGKIKSTQAVAGRSAVGRVRTKSLRDILDQEGRLVRALGSEGQWGSESPRGSAVRSAALRYVNNIQDSERWQTTARQRGFNAADTEQYTRAEYMRRRNNRR